jgi:signal transduction histidine kinase
MASQLSAFICEPGANLPEVFDTLEVRFKLPKPLIHEVVAATLQRVDELAQTFELEVDSKRDTDALMEKARVVLEQLSDKLPEKQPPSDTGFLPPAEPQSLGDSTNAVRHTLETVEHEIRDPLTAVGGLVRRLAKTIDPASDQGKYVQVILAETERLEQALKGLAATLKDK